MGRGHGRQKIDSPIWLFVRVRYLEQPLRGHGQGNRRLNLHPDQDGEAMDLLCPNEPKRDEKRQGGLLGGGKGRGH